MARHGMISAPQPEAVEAGAVALMNGGNAVDAAIACAFVQTVVDPLMCGIAGFGSCQVYMPGQGAHTMIDFHGRVPRRGRPDMWRHLIEGETRDGFGFILKDRVNDLGYRSITTPGSLKAFHEVHGRFGKLPWRAVIAPAIGWATDGFAVSPDVYHYWMSVSPLGRGAIVDRLRFSPGARALYLDAEGSPKPIGTIIRNPDYARTLETIAAQGAETFYTGALAKRIADDMAAHDALLDARDLAAYRTVETPPLTGTYRGFTIATNRPPGGGIMLLEMLNILETFDVASLGHNTPEMIRVVAEAMKVATADKDAHVGDPAFVDVPVDRLTDKAYARARADAIRSGAKAHVPRLDRAESPHTTHISVIDKDGNVVSMTHSLGMMSGVITDGLGFMYNGCMAVFDPRPGRAGSIAPGKARFSSICPSIVFKDGKPVLVVGAPGMTQIAMGVLQVILNVIDFGMPIVESVLAPRFSATSDLIDVTARIPRYVSDKVAAMGYGIVRSPLSFGIASVHAVKIDGDELTGAADPAMGGGMALLV
jgi:gamma-glutamyltranspeptidase/glutathione hydrolase